ncbi:major facilitator superfamily domain-containing protein [Lipomyces tetrasporus]|uniref:Major facilitator superfamily domain-containing protein n=1 Tax=Lipomyces tetrasporus TaxID=54092 RepID=A0AAD7VUW7_9ASCO|nr:major facilitator superfamily domain-containing protein [Lipomyces tetrasporus]KAJ8103582.1 major facilitator superfamily domain-containing protein [Lipomyces tetrasporus]
MSEITEKETGIADTAVTKPAAGYKEADKSGKSIWIRMLSLLWDTAAKPPEEKKFLNKIDATILVYIMLSYLIKTLDAGNVQTAFVSGMREDLRLYGQELNLFTTYYNIGFLVASYPAMLMMTWFRPSIVVPSMEILWTVFVMLIAVAKNAETIYALRFFVGVGESICFPGFGRIIGSWYKPEELAKRTALFDISGALANMISGYIQAGVYHSLNGRGGLAGWRWLFIIDGVISLPVAFFGFWALPDYPTTTRARWLNERERALGVARMEAVGRRAPRKLTVKRMITMWWQFKPWAYMVPFILSGLIASANYMNLWLKSLGTFSVEEINTLPTIGYAMGMVSAFLLAIVNDALHWRVQCLLIVLFCYFLGNLLLGIWNINFHAKFFAYLVPRMGQPIGSFLLVWQTELFQEDAEMRGLLPGLGNAILFAMGAWVPLLIYPTPKAPHFPIGYWVTMAFAIGAALGIVFVHYYHRWDIKRRGMTVNRYGLIIDKIYLTAEEASTRGDIEGYGTVEEIDMPTAQKSSGIERTNEVESLDENT